jgi:negative regulator of sigma E activity
MNEERQNERDSQLSAMFDGELPAAECELLARRLVRDDALRSQWSRYALIGAALRKERGVRLDDRVARRVQSQIAQEATYGDSAAGEVARTPASVAVPVRAASAGQRWSRFVRPVMGAGIAAGVAAMSILWLRTQDSPENLLANNPAAQSVTITPEPVTTVATTQVSAPAPASHVVTGNGEPERYTTPAFNGQANIAPPARLANYVFAHSEYSSPLSRRLALLGLMSGEGVSDIPADAANVDAAGKPKAETSNDAH